MLKAIRASPRHGRGIVLATMLARDAVKEVSKTRNHRGQGRPNRRCHTDHAVVGKGVVSERGTRHAEHGDSANTMGRFINHGEFEVK